ncbi:MAG: DUF2017 family protein [Actinomycetota bacterium]|nr:DUF2017 family protein [Actinomycetota bacterium]
MASFRRPIRRLRDGSYSFDIDTDLKRFIADLAGQLEEVLGDDAPMLRRLFPTAYPDDPERDAGYQVFARGELIDQRQASIDQVRATVDQKTLSEEELLAWMRTVNDLRLVLGTQLDVSEDDDGPSTDDPHADAYHVYQVLGMALEEIVQGLT